MNNSISGKIVQIEAPITGESANGQWKRQNFIIETGDSFPKKICFTISGDKISLDSFPIGSAVTVYFNIDSHEHNGRWFTNFNAWQIEQATNIVATQVSIEGRITQVLPMMEGTSKATGKPWKKQDFVLETVDSAYPRNIAFTTWGDRVNKAILQENKEVTVFVDIASSPGTQGGWFSNVQAFRASEGIAAPQQAAATTMNTGYATNNMQSNNFGIETSTTTPTATTTQTNITTAQANSNQVNSDNIDLFGSDSNNDNDVIPF